MIEVGMKVIANWGAMHPVEYGTVTYVHDDGLANVMFDDGIYRMGLNVQFYQKGHNPIGVFVDENAAEYDLVAGAA